MDYNKIYQQIIERAKTRNLEGYKEQHHIIPKCLGGLNDEENLVYLTAREHFLCHLLLCEIHPKNNKLKQALFLMSINKNKKYVKYKISSRLYEKIKIQFLKIVKGRSKPKDFGLKINKQNCPNKGLKISKANKGISKPVGFGENLSLKTKGMKRSQEFINQHILRKKKPIIQLNVNGEFIKEWDSATVAGETLKLSKSSITACAKKRVKSCGGFLFLYKSEYDPNKIYKKPPPNSYQTTPIIINEKKYNSIASAGRILNIPPYLIHYRLKTNKIGYSWLK